MRGPFSSGLPRESMRKLFKARFARDRCSAASVCGTAYGRNSAVRDPNAQAKRHWGGPSAAQDPNVQSAPISESGTQENLRTIPRSIRRRRGQRRGIVVPVAHCFAEHTSIAPVRGSAKRNRPSGASRPGCLARQSGVALRCSAAPRRVTRGGGAAQRSSRPRGPTLWVITAARGWRPGELRGSTSTSARQFWASTSSPAAVVAYGSDRSGVVNFITSATSRPLMEVQYGITERGDAPNYRSAARWRELPDGRHIMVTWLHQRRELLSRSANQRVG